MFTHFRHIPEFESDRSRKHFGQVSIVMSIIDCHGNDADDDDDDDEEDDDDDGDHAC